MRVRLAATLLLCVAISCGSATNSSATREAVPQDPVLAVLGALQAHQVVALGEGAHGNEQGHAVRMRLVTDPRFALLVDDIVVEFGNSRYQDTLDRFIRGENVADAALRHVWQDTTQAHPIWDVPIYEAFFRAVRAANLAAPERGPMRVLLGDPPVDWSQVLRREDFARQPRRTDRFVFDLMQREVLSKGRRALVIYGELHLMRATPTAPTLVQLLERNGTKVFSIWTNATTDLASLQPNTATWLSPRLTALAGTALGVAPLSLYYRDGRPGAKPIASPLQDQFDALLDLGRPENITYSMPSAELCRDPEYLKMRIGRMEMFGLQDQVERGKKYCAQVAQPPVN